MNKLKVFFVLLFSIVILASVQAQEETLAKERLVDNVEIKAIVPENPQPIVLTDSAVRHLTWDSTDTVFAYLEKDTIYLRDAETYKLIGTVEFPQVMDFSMYQEEAESIQIIACSEDGTLAVWTLPLDTANAERDHLPTYLNNPLASGDASAAGVEGDNSVDVVTFSENSNYIAAHFVDNPNVDIYFRLRYTNEVVPRQTEALPAPVYSMAFSSENDMLATAGTDGFLRVWNTFNGKLAYEHSFYAESRVPVSYITGNYNILATTDVTILSVLDPTGNILQSIDAEAPILYAQQFADGRRVAILTNENRLKLYELENGAYLGYIPSFNVTDITSFDFNSTTTSVLVGHNDGSIYKIDLESNIIAPSNLPLLRLIRDDEVVVKGEEFTESIPEPEYGDGAEVVVDSIFFKPGHGIEALVGFSVLPSPNVMDLDITVGYLNSFWLHPFHVGARLITSIGFPRHDFPYNYRLWKGDQWEPLQPPLMMSMTMKFPIGVAFTPFKNKDIMLYAEASLGMALHQLWNRRFGNETIAGLLHPSFVGSIAVGAGWKGLSLKLHGDYDARLGFLFSVNIGWLFELPYKKKVKTTPSPAQMEGKEDIYIEENTSEAEAKGETEAETETEAEVEPETEAEVETEREPAVEPAETTTEEDKTES